MGLALPIRVGSLDRQDAFLRLFGSGQGAYGVLQMLGAVRKSRSLWRL